jgi:hypothetical protein
MKNHLQRLLYASFYHQDKHTSFYRYDKYLNIFRDYIEEHTLYEPLIDPDATDCNLFIVK